MTPENKALLDALREYNAHAKEGWDALWSAIAAWKESGTIYDASFPPEILREMDAPALNSSVMYRIVEAKTRDKAIQRALGYNA